MNTGKEMPGQVKAPVPTEHKGGLYERFMELPVPVVILSLWLAGAAFIGLGTLTLYYLFWLFLL
jgi:hypothetical protein